jgi:peptidoglycan hydrolase-like protein with peptidoglycan-binding domain
LVGQKGAAVIAHAGMRSLLSAAFTRIMRRAPSLPEVQCLQAIAWLESSYGRGWNPAGDKSKNLGAIQAGASWKGKTFQYGDTTPQLDGSSKKYVTKFRWYKTWEDAADDLVRAVYVWSKRGSKVLPFATAGDTHGFSSGLYDTVYYEGFGKDGPDPGDSPREERIDNHHRQVAKAIRAQCEALHEDLPADLIADTEPPVPLSHRPVLRLGSSDHGDPNGPVHILQRLLNKHDHPLVNDGEFGPLTLASVKAFQHAHPELNVDGAVGPKTWNALGG